VLLHMVPPTNDRTNFPQAFIDALTQRGLTVLNVDRRGTPKSGGDANEAHKGPNGKLDAKAAYDFLQKHACAVDMSRLVFIGASNGTTTALDFAVYAGAQASITLPRALVFLTGGIYTENQNKIADNLNLLKAVSIQFVYSTAESTWSAAFKASAPAVWEFLEYSGVSANDGHGTGIFTAKPESVNAVARFVEQVAKN
jgi:acetyl esterase/lipase